MLLSEGQLGMALAPSESPQPRSLPASFPPASPTGHLQPLHPAARMIFQKHKSQHGLSLPGEKWCWLPAAFRKKNRPGASAWGGEVGGGPHLSSVISLHQPCSCPSCTQPLSRPRAPHVPLPAHHPPLNEYLLFLRSSHFSLCGDFTAYPSLVSLYSLLLFPLCSPFFTVARGVLRQLTWMLSPPA